MIVHARLVEVPEVGVAVAPGSPTVTIHPGAWVLTWDSEQGREGCALTGERLRANYRHISGDKWEPVS